MRDVGRAFLRTDSDVSSRNGANKTRRTGNVSQSRVSQLKKSISAASINLGNKETPLNCGELKRKLDVLEDVEAGELKTVQEEK